MLHGLPLCASPLTAGACRRRSAAHASAMTRQPALLQSSPQLGAGLQSWAAYASRRHVTGRGLVTGRL